MPSGRPRTRTRIHVAMKVLYPGPQQAQRLSDRPRGAKRRKSPLGHSRVGVQDAAIQESMGDPDRPGASGFLGQRIVKTRRRLMDAASASRGSGSSGLDPRRSVRARVHGGVARAFPARGHRSKQRSQAETVSSA